MSLSFPVAPMKATMGSMPAGDGWAFEIKWDGYRTLAFVDGDRVRLQSTSGKDVTERWPEFADLPGSVHADRAILDAIVGKFGGGPVGLSTLAIAVGEEPETVEDAYEPFLLLEGFLQRTPRGRIATERAYEHLGVERAGVESPQGRLLD